MATRTLESRFERMSVNDENDPNDGSKYQKTKVGSPYLRNLFHTHIQRLLQLSRAPNYLKMRVEPIFSRLRCKTRIQRAQ